MDTVSKNKSRDGFSSAAQERTETIQLQQQQQQSKWGHCRTACMAPWYKDISVEPTMFLYMFAFMMTSVIEQDFFLQRACRVNMNYTDEICQNIKSAENVEYKRQVQIAMAIFLQWESLCAHIFPIILALFLGSFSDKRGRKFMLLLGLSGKLYYSLMIILNASMPNWPVEYVLFTATLPCSLTGADLAIFASCFTYLSDISTLNNRTLRITLLDVIYLSAMPSGVALGSYLFSGPFNGSYVYMFTLNAVLMTIAIFYTTIALKWQTTLKQRPLLESGCCGIVRDFFDKQHFKDTFDTLIKPRPGHRRMFLSIVLVAMALYTFQRDENQYLFQYTRFAFQWTTVQFSNFKTFKSTAYVVGVLLAVPLMNKVFHWRDTTIIFIGTVAHASARIFYYFAATDLLFYVGALICSLGPVVAPMLRSITSKMVSQSERGKVFALLAVCDNAIPTISGVCYSQVYRATVNANGEGGAGIFLLTIATQVAVFLLALCVHLMLGEGSLAVPEICENESGLIAPETEVDIAATAEVDARYNEKNQQKA